MKNLIQLMQDKYRLNDAYKRVFDSPDGQLVLAHLARTNFVFTPTLVRGDPQATAMHEGQRRLVLSIMRQLHIDYQKLDNLMQETQNVEI
ncbi:MAG TPA: hypothetical protein VD999_07935 [Vitreimonas sp.]|nr:hypothetical protein [Vitreimonas sp.]